jgi:hypothetical protein
MKRNNRLFAIVLLCGLGFFPQLVRVQNDKGSLISHITASVNSVLKGAELEIQPGDLTVVSNSQGAFLRRQQPRPFRWHLHHHRHVRGFFPLHHSRHSLGWPTNHGRCPDGCRVPDRSNPRHRRTRPVLLNCMPNLQNIKWESSDNIRRIVGLAGLVGTLLFFAGDMLFYGHLGSAANFASEVLGVYPAFGRGFLPDDNQTGHDQVVILSHGFWQRRLGASPSALGSAIQSMGDPTRSSASCRHASITRLPWNSGCPWL